MLALDPLALSFVIAVVPGALVWVLVVAAVSRRLLHVLQLEEYELGRFWQWVRGHPDEALPAAQRGAALALLVFGVRVRARIARRAVTTNRLPGLAPSYRTARHAR